ncbi:putative type IX secretion system sortase PorU2 [Flexibacter flexilis]|nr:C25 family cysteine peptidase [Flexibacter flexilis]
MKLRSLTAIFILATILFCTTAHAQSYGNEWINYAQSYYKIPITTEGIYRIDRATLQQAGVPVGSFSPRNLQLWHRGVEQAITVEGETDGIFNDGDYILFYAKGNDGKSDLPLYKPAHPPQSFKNIYSDTAAYFLTWTFSQMGKRISYYGTIPTNLTPLSYQLTESMQVFQNQYSLGQGHLDNYGKVHTSWNGNGEGWTGALLENNQAVTYTLPLKNVVFTATTKPILNVFLAGQNGLTHRVQISVSANNGISFTPLDTVSFAQYYWATSSVTVPNDLMTGNTLQVRITVLGYGTGATDAASVSAIQFTYAQNYNLNGLQSQAMIIEPTNTGNALLAWQNIPTGTTFWDVTTEGYTRRLLPDALSRTGLDSLQSTRRLWVTTSTSNITATQIQPITFRNINPSAHNYIIVSHPKLMKPAGATTNAVKEYASYRASAAGGSFDTLIVDVSQIFNQFGYGEPTPWAIRKFASYMLSGTRKPDYLLLIGKGQEITTRFSSTYAPNNLIPPFGLPASDALFTFGLDNNLTSVAIPVGRIAATTPQMVLDYLDKVKSQAQLGYTDFWRKNMIHISGGISTGEINLLHSLIDQHKTIAEGDYFGGNVTLISKSTSAIVQTINIAEEANKGLSMINVFGHASVDGPDMDMGRVSNAQEGYNNKDKYPFVLINGCFAGNIFTERMSLNEDWVLAKEKGAVAFMANTDEGIISVLDKFAKGLYTNMFADNTLFGSSLGKIQKITTKNAITGSFSILDTISATQTLLHGDPAIVVFGATKPDYKTSDAEVSLLTNNISAATNVIELQVIVSNFGKISKKNMQIGVRRTTGNGSVLNFAPQTFNPVLSKDTLTLKIEDYRPNLSGLNTFEIRVDVNDSISELNENNNIGIVKYFVPETGLAAIFPKRYSIVNHAPVELIAQSTNLLSANNNYIFEIDTSAQFTSSLHRIQPIAAGNIARWQVNNFPFSDSTVYYWRVKFQNDTVWQNSSFIYISGSMSGWSQSHFYQFTESQDIGVEKITYPYRYWTMPVISKRLQITSAGIAINNPNYVFKFDGLDLFHSAEPNRLCSITDARWVGLTLNGNDFSTELYNYANTPNYWEYSCGRQPSVLNFFYGQDANYLSPLVSYYKDFMTAPQRKGYYTILMKAGKINHNIWPDQLLDTLEASYGLNRAQFSSIPNGAPIILITRRGAAPNSARIVTYDHTSPNPPDTQYSSIDTILNAQPAFGTITSSSIGPATSWGKMYYKVDNQGFDKSIIQVIGVTTSGADTVLISNVPHSDYDLSAINASIYPYLKLRAIMRDTVNFTPPTLKKWQVIYNGVPEGTINTDYIGVQKYSIPTQQEGATFNLPFMFENISNRDFTDSLKVEYTLLSGSNPVVKSFNIKPLVANDTVRFTLKNIPTLGHVGTNNLQIFVNPRLLPEESYANNFLSVTYEVVADQTNPLLDVAFDGVRIMNGDIVSPTPLISINLRDENQYLLLNDTASMSVTLSKCDGTAVKTISSAQADVRVYPATASNNNQYRLEYQPATALTDGCYTLTVRARDISENGVGVPYKLNFEVISASSVTHFYPYPNPFSTSTRFVFTLTGSEIPEDIKIQIMTVSGKVVREITRQELGNIRIGNNITNFAWDGTDEYGDKLANGVYLYRVQMQHNGQALDHRQTAADNNFKHGFGKMYIMR